MDMTREQVEALPWIDVENSSNIERVAFGDEPDKQADLAILYVQFAGGRMYAYEDVPYELNIQLKKEIEDEDASVGRFVAQNVRNNFDVAKIEVIEAVD